MVFVLETVVDVILLTCGVFVLTHTCIRRHDAAEEPKGGCAGECGPCAAAAGGDELRHVTGRRCVTTDGMAP